MSQKKRNDNPDNTWLWIALGIGGLLLLRKPGTTATAPASSATPPTQTGSGSSEFEPVPKVLSAEEQQALALAKAAIAQYRQAGMTTDQIKVEIAKSAGSPVESIPADYWRILGLEGFVVRPVFYR